MNPRASSYGTSSSSRAPHKGGANGNHRAIVRGIVSRRGCQAPGPHHRYVGATGLPHPESHTLSLPHHTAIRHAAAVRRDEWQCDGVLEDGKCPGTVVRATGWSPRLHASTIWARTGWEGRFLDSGLRRNDVGGESSPSSGFPSCAGPTCPAGRRRAC